jgi:hypothetical protein
MMFGALANELPFVNRPAKGRHGPGYRQTGQDGDPVDG